MSMEEARQKLIEFIKMVGAAPKDRLLRILELFEKFYEDSSYRSQLMSNIRMAVLESIGDVFYQMSYRVRYALALYDQFITVFYLYYGDIVVKGDIEAFIAFLNESIRVLESDYEY
ncbi:MAG: hypothetical protein JHC33_08100, partial [Ignisphaera sp.]|nr:hypothetical protein [Ignisphaera sp.]